MADDTNGAGVIELNAHDVTRIWNLAIAIYDGDDPDADLRDFFAQALDIYLEFTTDLAAGGLVFSDDDKGVEYVSEREVKGGEDIVRFRPHAKEKEKKKGKKKKE